MVSRLRTALLLFVCVAVFALPSQAATNDASQGSVPEPQPVECKYDLGVFYFPGWDTMKRWAPILGYPERKPVLGWYDEANPECVDWQIKWAVEHGVRFFMVDWYWDQGNRQLDHWLHKGYMNAKHRRYLQWCVMWANHNPPGSHSADDWRAVTQYWIDNYFGMDEYYRVDGRPVVVIWAPTNITRDVGGSQEVAKLFAMSQEMAKQAGHKGIYFVAMGYFKPAPLCAQQKAEGYEATTSYHTFPYVQKKLKADRRLAFSEVVRQSPDIWQSEDAVSSGLDYWPVIETGWSNEPWAGKDKALVVESRTPEQFGELCRLAREYADKHGKKILALGPWNEWGEGSYIEPCAEFGFAQLDAMRAALCEPGDYPPNLTPSEVGLGPYDLPLVAEPTTWRFDKPGDLRGWKPNGDLRVEPGNGVLMARSVGPDPILGGPSMWISANTTRQFVVRIKSNRPEQAQIFWMNPAHGKVSEQTSIRFDVPGDGQFHDCTVELSQHPEWQGVIGALRFDPAGQPGAKLEIEWIRLQ